MGPVLPCVHEMRIKGQTDGRAGARQSPHVTLEDKISHVMLGKTGGGEPLVLRKNRKGLCFLVAWLRAALRHVLGRLLPAMGESAWCLASGGTWGR